MEKISLKWGIRAFLGLSAYFLIMKFIGLIHIPELRILNAGILFTCVFLAIKESKKTLSEFNYFMGIGTGVATAFVASTIFAVFGFGYITFINPDFIESIRSNELFGIYMNKYGASFQIFIEGSASGCLMSYSAMQYLKVRHISKA
ncbi:MAG: DUF4199 domain-containing protein [Bacteroidota bacterium]